MSRETVLIRAEAVRAARALLGWSLEDLATAADVAPATLSRFENGRPIRRATAERIRAALHARDVELIGPDGRSGAVRLDREASGHGLQPEQSDD